MKKPSITIADYQKMKPVKLSESQLQQTCVRWFRLTYPDVLIFAVPNGGSRNGREAAKMKREGVTAGIPDLMIAQMRKLDIRGIIGRITHLGLFIEMKVKPNKPSPEQLEKIRQLSEAGYKCEICYSFSEFEKAVTDYLGEHVRFQQKQGKVKRKAGE